MKINLSSFVVVCCLLFSCAQQSNDNGNDSSSNYGSSKLNKIDLIVSPERFGKIQAKRDEAIDLGILFSEDDDWQKAKIVSEGDTLKAKLRLKGDWTDHLQGKKWSYRIQTGKKKYWNGMRNFSVQSPHTRHFLSEWVYHKLLGYEDVLSPRYSFAELSMNGEDLGIFAVEEHFDKHLVEAQNRREGPILKFNEDGLWETRLEQSQNGSMAEGYLPIYESAEVAVFKKNRTAKSAVLTANYQTGSGLLYQWQHQKGDIEKIADIDLLAKFYAINDISKAYHGLVWHNLRFYFNPVTTRLEPIGFDGYTETGAYESFLFQPFIGHSRNNRSIEHTSSHRFLYYPFTNQNFTELYIKHLNRISKSAYLDAFFKSIESELNDLEKTLQQEYSDYNYDRGYFYKNAANIQTVLKPKANISLLAYKQLSKTGFHYQLANFYSMPVVLTHARSNQQTIKLSEDVLVQANNLYKAAVLTDYTSSIAIDSFCYRIPGLEDSFWVATLNHPFPKKLDDIGKQQNIQKAQNIKAFNVSGNVVYVPKANYTFMKPIVLEKGWQLNIAPGTKLNFVNSSYLIAYGPVFARGNAESPILIESTDKSAMGLSVFNAKQRSIFKHTLFKGLNTLSLENWSLTGGVSFYESDVSISNCGFTQNVCEDALNIIRSSFQIEQSHFSNTFGDAFDADFAHGKIITSSFNNIGNDAIDFSGSSITIDDVKIIDPEDKGVSVGEVSTVTIHNIEISGSPLAVAVKDLSKLTIENISIKDSEVGFCLFQKKAEYGPAKLTVQQYKTENVNQLHKVQEKSVINIDDQEHLGTLQFEIP